MNRPTAPAGALALVRKDVRCLLPLWTTGVVVATLAGLTDTSGAEAARRFAFTDLQALQLATAAAVIVGLGAQSFGHEYSHRTLGLLLALPLSRRRVYVVKHAVLAAMLLPLTVYMWRLGLFAEFPALAWFTGTAALCLAPWCSMVGRSALAGATFTAMLPAMAFLLPAMAMTIADPAADAERGAWVAWEWMMAPLLAGGAMLGWRRFVRLDAIDCTAASRVAASPTRRPRAAPRHPLWAMVRKELGLHRVAFAMVLFYAGLTVIAALVHLRHGTPPAASAAFRVASAFYWAGLPVLMGAVATAEERQLGTLTWQLLLPLPAWLQWTVKAAVVFGIAPLLTVGAPLLVGSLFWPGVLPNVGLAAGLAAITTAASLYVSSLCTSGLRAALVSLVGVPLVLWLVGASALAFGPADFVTWRGRVGLWLALGSIVVAVLLGFAAVNHRAEPPPAARVRRQLVALAAVVGIGVALVVGTA